MPSKDQISRYTDVAKNVLAMCRKIQPNFWNPETNPEMAEAWGYVFATKPYAPACYYEAVGAFYAEDHSGDRPTPGQIAHYANVVRNRWESDPIKRAELNAHRDFLRDQRDRQLADGTFAEIRGYKRRPAPQHQRPSALPSDLLGDIGKGMDE